MFLDTIENGSKLVALNSRKILKVGGTFLGLVSI